MSAWNLIGWIAAAAATYAVVRWAIIKLSKIINWFRDRSLLKQSDKKNLAFTLKEKTAQGDYVVYQGIYSQSTDTVIDGQKIISQQVDAEFENLHSNQPLVIYE